MNMDINNVGMNPILDGGTNKKTLYMWVGVVVVIIIIIGFWYLGGNKSPVTETTPVDTNSTTTNQVPKKAPTPTSTPDINLDAKG